MTSAPEWSAIVLAGGRSTRMGTDKLAADIGGATPLVRVLSDLGGAVPVVVVGPEIEVPPGIARPTVVREEPAFGGPAAAIAAALPQVRTTVVAVIAGDMPFAASIAEAAVARLPADADGCVSVDEGGRRQYLCAAYRTEALRIAVAAHEPIAGVAVRALLTGLSIVEFRAPDDALVDLDEPDDVERARRIADTGSS